jgi:hypothetical protein
LYTGIRMESMGAWDEGSAEAGRGTVDEPARTR